jgi:hypothetical protein
VVLAADMNNIRDQLNATAPATLTAQGDIVIASGANALARLAKSTTSTQYLANTGTSNAPAWNEVALATGVSGTLPVGNGGTGGTSLTANGILVGNSTSAVAVTATMATKGHVMIGDGSGVPSMLAVGSNDEVLTADSGEATGVKWAAAAGGGPSQADQAAVEAETNQDTYIPPDLLKHHPGIAKAWGTCNAAGTLQSPSYGLSSVTDDTTGVRTYNFSTSFSDVDYVIGGLENTLAVEDSDCCTFDTNNVGNCRIQVQEEGGSRSDNPHGNTFHGDQ